MKSISHTLASAALVTTLLLAGCGLAETGAATAAGGATAAEQAKQAKEKEAEIERQIVEMQKSRVDQSAAMEAEAQ
jgi:hypothetical protein